jgi:hypothetical protein
MKDMLQNLALIDLINFCKQNNIPPNGHGGEGSRVVKRERGFVYELVSATTGKPIVSVRFYKHQTPTHEVFAQ